VNLTALLCALGAALGFAISSPLQHHAAGTAPGGAGALGLLGHLVRQPRWLVGQVLALMSFCLHAYALHVGVLALVQPIVVSGIVFAVPIRAALSRHLPPRGEVVAVVITAVGLATLLVAAGDMSSAGVAPSTGVALAMTVALVGLATAAYLLVGRADTAATRAGLCGITAGILFGLVSGMVKLTLDLWDNGVPGPLSLWPIPTMALLGLSGVAVNQRAYRLGALSASMPILNIVNVGVALTLGLLVFHEVPAHTPAALLGQGFALVCICFGLIKLSAHAEIPQLEGHAEQVAEAPRT
jgi:hypothetical protein